MSIMTTRRLTTASVAVSTALVLSACGSSGKIVTGPTSHGTTSSGAAPSSPAAVTTTAPSIPPGPAFTAQGISDALLTAAEIGPKWKVPSGGTGKAPKAETSYMFGCMDVGDDPPSHPVGTNVSQAEHFMAGNVYDTTGMHLKSLMEQYILFPDAKTAAAEQKAIEATVTPTCLASRHVAAGDSMPAYTVGGTQAQYSHGGFTGMTLHETSKSDDQTPVNEGDQITEARDGSVLMILFVTQEDYGPLDATFSADALASTGKALDKVEKSGH